MDRAAPSAQGTAQRNPSAQPGSHPQPQPAPAPQGGSALIAGRAFVQTVRHFFPDLNQWLQKLPDTRDRDSITYETRFMGWWGLWLYLGQLGSRRQLDYSLHPWDPGVLPNLNRLAETQQTTRPVHDTLDHFLEHVALSGWERLRTQMVQRLLRMKVLDAARLQGRPVLIIDATGWMCFHKRHCDQCLTQRHGKKTFYLHQILEAKLLGPGGVLLSLGSEFIENADAGNICGRSEEEIKQDCELKALLRLAPRIKTLYPQLPFVMALDSLYACGPVFALAKQLGWSFVATFKEGRTPTLWQEFQALLPQCPQNVLRREWVDRPAQTFRWVPQLAYEDSEGRAWKLNALECTETAADGPQRYFAWLTWLPVNRKTVEGIAQKGGRDRWKIENEGFNRQKNSGLNLEHVYSIDPEKSKAYYLLLQIAFILTQLFERGSLLQRLANELGRKAWDVFGSLKNLAGWLLDSLRYQLWEDDWFDAREAKEIRIRFDSS